MAEQFIGAVGLRAFYIQAIRAAFAKPHFDVCVFHGLPAYNSTTFAGWVRDLHCKHPVSEAVRRAAQFYCVNYFLCPETEDEFEVEALVREVFPDDCPPPARLVFRIGKYTVYKESKDA